jgi:hypothetical protein
MWFINAGLGRVGFGWHVKKAGRYNRLIELLFPFRLEELLHGV